MTWARGGEEARAPSPGGAAVIPDGSADVRPMHGLPSTFEALALPVWMCDALRKGMGFEAPTPVQQTALPKGRAVKHVVVQAKSGTGKTVTFSCIAVEKACGVAAPHAAPLPSASASELERDTHAVPRLKSSADKGAWSLIVAPTRELALQHELVVRKIAAWAPRRAGDGPLQVLCAVGGTSKSARDNAAIAQKLRDPSESGVLIATPGRLFAVGSLCGFAPESFRRVRCTILDEADRLLEGNYDDQLGPVLAAVPERAQVLAFSATYTDNLRRRIESITGRSNFVLPGAPRPSCPGDGDGPGQDQDQGGGQAPPWRRGGSVVAGGPGAEAPKDLDLVTLERIAQFVLEVDPEQTQSSLGQDSATGGSAGRQAVSSHGFGPMKKMGSVFQCKVVALLSRVLSVLSFDQAIFFCNHKSFCKVLVDCLLARGYCSAHICGDMPQSQRAASMHAMRSGRARILVATDLVARGIDMDRVTLVVNLDLPKNGRTLLHRIGRTGRFGTKGTAVHIVTRNETAMLTRLLEEAGAYHAKVFHMPEEPQQGGLPGDEVSSHHKLVAWEPAPPLPPRPPPALPVPESDGGARPCSPRPGADAGAGERDGKSSTTLRSAGWTSARNPNQTEQHPGAAGAGFGSALRGPSLAGGQVEVDTLPEQVQRWIWWQWRWKWWCEMQQSQ